MTRRQPASSAGTATGGCGPAAGKLIAARMAAGLRVLATGWAVAFLSLASLSPTAGAESLRLEGVWGNPAGCRFLNNQNDNDDSRLVVTADRVETYAIYCEWVEVGAATDGTQVATGLCGHEGEDYRTAETFIIEQDLVDRTLIRVRAADGTAFGEVRACK